MNASAAGENWKQYLSGSEVSWCNPERVGPEYFLRHAQSEWITRILQHTGFAGVSGRRSLEAGCGTGVFSLSLASLGWLVDAFDYNDDAIRIAHSLEIRAREKSPNIQVHFYQDNLLKIHATAAKYDLVFNQAVLEYFTRDDERQQALLEMSRVTVSEGWVAVIVQHTAHPFRRIWEWMGWPGYIDQPPVIAYTPAKLMYEFRAAGLVNVATDDIYPWKAFFFWPQWYWRRKWTANMVYLFGQMLNRFVPLPRSVRTFLGTQFLVVGQKP